MAHVTVGTGAGVKLDLTPYPEVNDLGQTLFLQNLGTGDIYIDVRSDVSTTTGLKVPAGSYFKLNPLLRQDVYVTASAASTDLRYVIFG